MNVYFAGDLWRTRLNCDAGRCALSKPRRECAEVVVAVATPSGELLVTSVVTTVIHRVSKNDNDVAHYNFNAH